MRKARSIINFKRAKSQKDSTRRSVHQRCMTSATDSALLLAQSTDYAMEDPVSGDPTLSGHVDSATFATVMTPTTRTTKDKSGCGGISWLRRTLMRGILPLDIIDIIVLFVLRFYARTLSNGVIIAETVNVFRL